MKKIYSYSLSAAFVAALLSVSSVANAQDNNAAVTAEASQDAAVATFVVSTAVVVSFALMSTGSFANAVTPTVDIIRAERAIAEIPKYFFI